MDIPRNPTIIYPQTPDFQVQDYTWDNGDLAAPPSYSPSANQSDPPTYTYALTAARPSSEELFVLDARLDRPPIPENSQTIEGAPSPSYEELFPKTCLSISRKAFADCCIKSSDAAKMFATCCFESGNTAIGACTPSQERCIEIKQSARECGEVLNSQHTVSIPSGIIGLVLCINNEAIAGSVCLACCCFIEAIGYCEKNSRRI